MLTSSRRHHTSSYHSAMAGDNDSSSMMLMPPRAEVGDRRGKLEQQNPADMTPSPRSSVDWPSNEVLDLSPCSAKDSNDQRDSSPAPGDESFKKRNQDDVTSDGGRDSDVFDDDSDSCSPPCGVSVAQAKRARVENIVTNIRDRPGKPRSTSDDDVISDDRVTSPVGGETRKRKIEEKLREWQEKISQEGVSSPSEFIQQALNLVASSSDASNTNFIENLQQRNRSPDTTTWSPTVKRPRVDGGFDGTKTHKGGYRGAINVSIPDGRGAWAGGSDTVAYDVVLETLKRELSFVFDKVTERLARRVCEELEGQTGTSPVPQTAPGASDEVFLGGTGTPVKRGDKRMSGEYDVGKDTDRESSFVVEDGIEHLRTSSQSQMCFGNVEVRREKSAGKAGEIRRGDVSDFTNLGRKEDLRVRDSLAQHVKTEESFERKTTSEPLRPRSLMSQTGEQTQALSLVTRRTSTNSDRSPREDSSSTRAFVSLDSVNRGSRSNDEDPRRHPESPRSSGDAKRDFIPVSYRREEPRSVADIRNIPSLEKVSFAPASRKSVFSSFFPARTPSLIPIQESSSLQAAPGWNLPTASGAFRQPTRQHNGSSPSGGHHFSSMHLDAQQKLISNLSSPDQGHMKTPALSSPYFPGKSSLYSPLQSSPLSSYPFPSGQIPFPLIPAFHQGALASALASRDYGRLREGLDHASLRHLSSRTSTRESGKTRGLMNHHLDMKCDATDFGGNSTDVSPYSAASIQEGLTPQHLKKAKLMFFYTRYPSANTLKTFFSDVKFTRATTSQLIKWFSNFREFYYIQVEKFARQALTDGITEANQLQVSRDSEVFRVLNLHYNKSNDFRVPDKFIDVTYTSLQEFFLAIQSGKDHDPAWKKVIYKVICKLDQDIPELFKSPNVLEHLGEI